MKDYERIVRVRVEDKDGEGEGCERIVRVGLEGRVVRRL